MGSYSLLQGIFPTQGLNLGLLPCRQVLFDLSHQRSPLLSHENVTHSAVSSSLQLVDGSPPGPRFLCPWNSPGKNTAVGCHSLFQGIFPTQGLNLGLLPCRQILYRLSYEGSRQEGLNLFRTKCKLTFLFILDLNFPGCVLGFGGKGSATDESV